MLDDPGKTSRLLAALKASLPFEVHLTPPLARLLRERRVVLPAGDRQTVSAVSYLGDARAASSATSSRRTGATWRSCP